MFNIQNHKKLGQVVLMTELYDYLDLDKSQYSRFVKSNITENPYFEAEKDYITFLSSENIGKRGNFRQDYLISIDAAKKICMVSKSKKGNEIRDKLVELTKKVENSDLVPLDMFPKIAMLIKVMCFWEYRQEALKRNKSTFFTEKLKEGADQKYIMAEFHKIRNQMLGTSKEELDTRMRQFCVLNKRPMPAKINQDTYLFILGQNEHIKASVYDLLVSMDRNDDLALKIAKVAQKVAATFESEIERWNKDTLYYTKKYNKDFDEIFSETFLINLVSDGNF